MITTHAPAMTSSTSEPLIIKHLLQADYTHTHEAMSARTLERIELAKAGRSSADELWIVDHNDVYTLGQAGKLSHILRQTDTPIIKTDRGGQVTWHGHGQLVVYWLFDLKSLGWSVRDLVSHAEQAIEDVVNQYLQSAHTEQAKYYAKARQEAPGVYIYRHSIPSNATSDEIYSADQLPLADPADSMLGKLASLGFKIKHGMSYHGIAVNLTCDLKPFLAINPCGYAGMTMLRLSDFTSFDYAKFSDDLIDNISKRHQGKIALRRIK